VGALLQRPGPKQAIPHIHDIAHNDLEWAFVAVVLDNHQMRPQRALVEPRYAQEELLVTDDNLVRASQSPRGASQLYVLMCLSNIPNESKIGALVLGKTLAILFLCTRVQAIDLGRIIAGPVVQACAAIL
jgi:hypothetical protein